MGGRSLADQEVHWDESVVGPILDQGQCGCCWAFSSTTVLAGSIAAINGTPYEHLSEQHLIECTKGGSAVNRALFPKANQMCINQGCYGGFLEITKMFMVEYGSIPYDTYPREYIASDQNDCEHDFSQAVNASAWGSVSRDEDVIAEKLQT